MIFKALAKLASTHQRACPLWFVVLLACPLVKAEQVLIRVVDDRNGHPISDEKLQLWFNSQSGSAMSISTDKQGVAKVDAPSGAVLLLGESVCRLPVLQTNRTGAPYLPSLRHLAFGCVSCEYLREAKAIANTGGADLLRKTRTLVGGHEALDQGHIPLRCKMSSVTTALHNKCICTSKQLPPMTLPVHRRRKLVKTRILLSKTGRTGRVAC